MEGVPPQGQGFHNFDLTKEGTFALDFTAPDTWNLHPTGNNFWLYLQPDGSYTNNVNGNPIYARKILITHNNTSPPFGSSSYSEIIVNSTVGWTGKGCTPMVAGDPATTNCNVSVTGRFTNWKDY